MEYMDNLGQ